MKKITSAMLVAAVLLTCTACSNSKTETNVSGSSSSATSAAEQSTVESSKNDTNDDSESTSSSSTNSANDDSKSTASSKVESSGPPASSAPVSGEDDLGDIVAKDIEDTVSELTKEYEELKAEIDTYDKYVANTDKVEAFYTKIYETHYALCIRIREYSLQFAETIVDSDISNDDKYDELKDIIDVFYDDAGDDINDGFYDGILDDMNDDFYDGILDDKPDGVEYREWSKAHSNEYKMWSNTRSDVYKDWSDFRSDVYTFGSDVRSEIYGNDIERAEKKIEKFRKDIEKLNSKN